MYYVLPHSKVPKELVYHYMAMLEANDLLKWRLCDIKSPMLQDAFNMIEVCSPHVYFVLSKDHKIVSEFTLESFTGKAAQIHFSMYPKNKPQESFKVGRIITDQVLNDWKSVDGSNYLDCLYGLTPTMNRAACAFVQRVGFKKIGILPSGQRCEGEPCDAMITIKESKNGW